MRGISRQGRPGRLSFGFEFKASRFLLWTLFLVLLGFPLWANLRAPFQMDGLFSGALKLENGEPGLVLLGEEIRVVFPDMDIRALSPEDTVSFTVTYEFDSRLPGEVTLPVHFIALDIQALEVALNGSPLPVEFSAEDEAKLECLKFLVHHRSSFLPEFYGRFLDRIGKKTTPDLTGEYLGNLSIRDIFDWQAPVDTNKNDFPLAGFRITLKPGRNSLILTYRQRFYVEERGHGYFSAWPEKGITGIDYLLYPIRTWPPAEDFKFRVSVEIPDFHKRKLFLPSWKIPRIKSNLSLVADYDRKKHLTRLRGDFDQIPADIFTLLVWVDKKAPDYLK